jgi:hypothetical protein
MVIAYVTFLSPEKGGRSSPSFTGYHSQVAVGNEYTSCVIESVDGETTFAFEQEHRVLLRLKFPDQYPEANTIGRPVRFFEGSHLVGSGIVLEVE